MLKYLSNLLFTFIIIGFVLFFIILVMANNKCDHNGKQRRFHFVAENSSANSDMAVFCKVCGEQLTTYARFNGTPDDKSYLSAFSGYIDSNEIIPGEYYTVTAAVTIDYYSSGIEEPRLACKEENDDYEVLFSVGFKEEYRDLISPVKKGEEITFRGKFYTEGCGFSDCELISRNNQNRGAA